MKYLETRYHDNGNVEARLWNNRPVNDRTDKYDFYVEEIGKDAADYENLEDWLENLEIELDDIIPLVIDLASGHWVDITTYI